MGRLTPTQELILEVLAARWRLGETMWTFDSRLRPSLERLADAGLVGTTHGIVERTVRAWLTEAGRAAALSPQYVPARDLSTTGHCCFCRCVVSSG